MKKILAITFLILLLPMWAWGATYYVDFTGGSDSNNGTAEGTAFKYSPGMSLATGTAASTTPVAGDTIYFKMGEVWRDTLTISWSGSSGSVITFMEKTDWGAGDSPKILCTESLAAGAWSLEASGVYSATIPNGVKYCGGILDSSGSYREDYYLQKPSYSSWVANYMYGYGGDYKVYYKATPGTREVGVREYGINITNNYIVIDGIDVIGPNGCDVWSYETNPMVGIKISGNSVTIQNCEVSCHKHCAIPPHGDNVSIINCTIADSQHGVYCFGDDGLISKCVVLAIGCLDGDSGDRHAITFNHADRGIIEDCYLDMHSSLKGTDAPAACICYADASNDGIIRRNYIKNVGWTAIAIGQPGGPPGTGECGSFEVYNNIIDKWGTNVRPCDIPNVPNPVCVVGESDDETHEAAGFGCNTASQADDNTVICWQDLSVYNNLFINGANPAQDDTNSIWCSINGTTKSAAAIILPGGYSEDRYKIRHLKVSNNIFYDNGGVGATFRDSAPYEILIKSNVKSGGTREFNNNQFYKSDTSHHIIFYPGVYLYDATEMATFNAKSYAANNQVGDPNLINAAGSGLNFALLGTSPCIDAGDNLGSGATDCIGAIDQFKLGLHPTNRVFNPPNSITANHLDYPPGAGVYDIGPFVYTGDANTAPVGVIDLPASNQEIAPGDSVTFNGTGTDGDGDSMTYLWNFDGGATNSTLEDPGSIQFNSAGTYTVVFTVTDEHSLADSSPPSVTIEVTPHGDPACSGDFHTAGNNETFEKGAGQFCLSNITETDVPGVIDLYNVNADYEQTYGCRTTWDSDTTSTATIVGDTNNTASKYFRWYARYPALAESASNFRFPCTGDDGTFTRRNITVKIQDYSGVSRVHLYDASESSNYFVLTDNVWYRFELHSQSGATCTLKIYDTNAAAWLYNDSGSPNDTVTLAGKADRNPQYITFEDAYSSSTAIDVDIDGLAWCDSDYCGEISADPAEPAPTVSSIGCATANGSYGDGDSIGTFTVTCSESVTVTGTPQLTLETGANDVVVNYVSGSPGQVLTFAAFNVSAAQNHATADLDAKTLALNGGTIQATDDSQNLDLTLPTGATAGSLASSKDIVINTSAFTITDIGWWDKDAAVGSKFVANKSITVNDTTTRILAIKLSEQPIVTGDPGVMSFTIMPGPLTASSISLNYRNTIEDDGVWYTLFDWVPIVGQRTTDLQSGAVGTAFDLGDATMANVAGTGITVTLPDTDLGSIVVEMPYPTETPKEFSSSSTLATWIGDGGYFIDDDFIETTENNSIGAVDLSPHDGSSGHLITLDGQGYTHPGNQTFGDYWDISRIIHGSTVTLGTNDTHSYALIPLGDTLHIPDGATGCDIENDGIRGTLKIDEATDGIYNTWITTFDPTGLDAAEPVVFYYCRFVESQAVIEAKDADDNLTFNNCQFSISTVSPNFRDYANNDFEPNSGSILIDTGTDTGAGVDLNGETTPMGLAHDIGPYEFDPTPGVYNLRITDGGGDYDNWVAFVAARGSVPGDEFICNFSGDLNTDIAGTPGFEIEFNGYITGDVTIDEQYALFEDLVVAGTFNSSVANVIVQRTRIRYPCRLLTSGDDPITTDSDDYIIID